MEYIGQLLWDENWGFGLVIRKVGIDDYDVWWYQDETDPWYGEINRKGIKKKLAKNCLDSSDGRAAPL